MLTLKVAPPPLSIFHLFCKEIRWIIDFFAKIRLMTILNSAELDGQMV